MIQGFGGGYGVGYDELTARRVKVRGVIGVGLFFAHDSSMKWRLNFDSSISRSSGSMQWAVKNSIFLFL